MEPSTPPTPDPAPAPPPRGAAPSPYAFAYPDLPIMAGREDILKALAEHQALVVQGGTGSGKTTQLPKFLLEAGYGEKGLIGVTQPRRIAALAITDRLRQETLLPNLIGSKIRFQEDVPPGAKVKVMTDGILLQEFRRDPLLRRYSCIILDEAHERSLNVDILLGIFKTLLPRRRDFRLVVTSATLDAERFANFLGTPDPQGKPAEDGTPAVKKAPVVEVEGRAYPVTIEYWDPQETGGAEDEDGEATPARAIPPVEAAAIAIRDLQGRKADNLLCFLPAEKEINELHRELERDLGDRFVILPLYSRLGPADQKKVFQESHRPKIILATNIAETSLTIPGIGYVVDTGLARISRYHAQTRIQGLPIERISQASARQRAGRAGRVKPGVCIRLYGEEEFNERPAFTEPEILRSNLANVVLQLLALGLPVEDFPWPDPPSPSAVKGAFKHLHELGAVSDVSPDAVLTEEGHKLARIPVDVTLGKILLKAEEFRTLQPALLLAAGVTIQDPRITPKDEPERGKAVGLHRRFEDNRSDFTSLLAMWVWIHKEWDSLSQRRLRKLCVDNFLSYNRVREWMDLAEQFARLLKVPSDWRKLRPDSIDHDALHKAILAGLLPFLARKKPEEPVYRLAGDKEAVLHPGSALSKRKPEWIVAGEVRQTSRTFIFRAAEIKPAWVEELAPEACKRTYFNVAWSGERGFVEAMERVTYKGFAIRQDRRVNYEAVAPDECADLFWREGVIHSDSGAPYPFRARNQEILKALASLERKARVRGLVPEEEAQAAFYKERAPGVTSRVRLERFLQGQPLDGAQDPWRPRREGEAEGRGEDGKAPAGRSPGEQAPAGKSPSGKPASGDASPAFPNEKRLTFSVGDWIGALSGFDWEPWAPAAPAAAAAAGAAASGKRGARVLHPLERLFPDVLSAGGHTYPVGYRFDYGDPGDGITLETDLDGLAGLSVPALFHGLPGWRAWIWEWAMERLSAKPRQQALERKAELAQAWAEGVPAPKDVPDGLPVPSPASVLAALLARTLDGTGLSLNFPATWPSYLSLHVLVKSPSGRRQLLHVDPSHGDSELFAAARLLAFGDEPARRPFPDWCLFAAQTHGQVPPPLLWRGLAYGVRLPAPPAEAPPPPRPGNAGATASAKPAPPAACGFFADPDEARFHRRLAAFAPAFAPREAAIVGEAARKPLAALFAKRLQALLDAGSCPDRFRKETAPWRDYLAEAWLPYLYLLEHGAESAARAEKDLPPTRATLPKPGSQVKSLAALGQAVGRGMDAGNWAGAALAVHAAGLSREAFARWYVFFAQPPLSARSDISDLIRAVTAVKAWEDLLHSPFHGAWAAAALAARLPGGAGVDPDAWTPPRAGGVDEVGKAWEAARAREEALRKGAKAQRDGFAGRYAALGQNLGGLPQGERDALETLDKAAPWWAKVEASLRLELHLNRAAAKAGSAGAQVVAGAAAAGVKAPPADPAVEARKEQLMKGLSGRFKKL